MSDSSPDSNPFRLLMTEAPNVNWECKVPWPKNDYRLTFDHRILKVENPETEEEKKIFKVEFDVRVSNTERTLTLFVKYHVVFRCEKEVTQEYLNSSIIKINASAIAFPFVRSFITTITANAGYPPVYLPSINFVKLLSQPSGDEK